jgi:hypothetical protein
MLDPEPETSGENTGLRRALEAADPATLLLALVQLTGERHRLKTVDGDPGCRNRWASFRETGHSPWLDQSVEIFLTAVR